ncbi:hypothetical protein FACS189426_03920 [Bacteroidia bacterium]|nr:hypothetical protein FACS189426_03920 [Bacteroidia bacterium]
MQQAARSGKQNEEHSVEENKMRELAGRHNDSAFYMNIVKTRPPETIANSV